MISKRNLPNHELIGLGVSIDESKNKSLVGKRGVIVDESRNTFTLRSGNEEKKIIKKDSSFIFDVEKKKIRIKGEKIIGNPWERLKKRMKVKNRWETLE